MRVCNLIYMGHDNTKGNYERPMGQYDFDEIPNKGDAINIFGSGVYTVIKIEHVFIKDPCLNEIIKQKRVDIYVM